MKRVLCVILLLIAGMAGQTQADVARGRLFWTTHSGVKTAVYFIDASGNLTLGAVYTVASADIDMAVFEPGGHDIIAGAHDHIIRIPAGGGPAINVSASGANTIADHIAIDIDSNLVYSSQTGGPAHIPPARLEATDLTTGAVTSYDVEDATGNPIPVSGLTFGDPDDGGAIAPILFMTDNDSGLYTVDLSGIGVGTTLTATKILDLASVGNLAHQVTWSQSLHELYVVGGNALTQIQIDVTGAIGDTATLSFPTGTIFDNARRRGDHIFITDVAPPNHEIYLVDLNGEPSVTGSLVTVTSLGVSDIDDIIPLEAPGAPASGPRVLTDPIKVNIGYVPVGATGSENLVISNIGDEPLEISSIVNVPEPFSFTSYELRDENDSAFENGVVHNLPVPVVLGPDTSLVLTVEFEPGQQNAETDFYETIVFFTNNLGVDASEIEVDLCGTTIEPTPDNVKVTIGTDFGAPGETLKLPISVHTGGFAVGGVQMDILSSGTGEAHFVSLEDTANVAPGFSVSANVIDDTLRILILSLKGAFLPPGSWMSIGRLVYTLDADNAQLGTVIDVEFGEVSAGDSLGNPLTVMEQDGELQVGVRGDLNLDGRINIFDVIRLVRIIVMKEQEPEEGTVFFNIANANGMGEIDVIDVIYDVNMILGLPVVNKPTVGLSGPVTVGLGGLQTLSDGRTGFAVTLNGGNPVAGLQATLTFDPAMIRIGAPYLATTTPGVALESHVVGGALRMVVYTTSPVQGIGQGTVVLIPASLIEGASPDAGVTLSGVTVVSPHAAVLPVDIGAGAVKLSGLPTAFGLKGNRPNPFNPSTTISYEVPQQARVTLTVYNLIGQEVVRLVNEVRAPGHYTVVWNGRNAQGLGVASGVYLYRMTTDTGFTETRRMTLLK